MLFLGIILPFGLWVLYVRYFYGGRMHLANGEVYSENATIVKVSSVPTVRNIKTIVVFSDGTEYHTIYTEPTGFNSRGVNAETIKTIKENALKAHQIKVEKQKQKKAKKAQ